MRVKAGQARLAFHPGGAGGKRSEAAMPIWIVKATWTEDEAEASERWEVAAATAHEAVRDATAHIRFQPHHVEARLCSAEEEARTAGLRPGQARRVPPG